MLVGDSTLVGYGRGGGPHTGNLTSHSPIPSSPTQRLPNWAGLLAQPQWAGLSDFPCNLHGQSDIPLGIDLGDVGLGAA
jgi:hypothetical protein